MLLWWRRRRWHPVARVGELKPGQVIAVTVAGIDMVLGLDGDRYFAVQRRCVHRGADLAGAFIAKNQLVCPQHGWRFSTADGRGGALPDACLQMYGVRVVGDQIEIEPTPKKRPR